MHFLLANDDGIQAIGLRALSQAILERGHSVVVCAPQTQQSAVSHHITLFAPLMMREVPWEGDNAKAYSVAGTPADCVRIAQMLTDKPFDFAFSGINNGENAGTAVFVLISLPTERSLPMPGDLQGSIRQYCSCLQEWNASYEDYARSVGLSFTSLSILSTIYAHENCTQKMLCEICFLPKQTVNGVIRQFCKDGWISLIEMAKDRRNKAIRFTEQGRQAAGDILRRVRQSEQAAMQSLSPQEQSALLTLTRRYVLACKKAMEAPSKGDA